jgi:hypothetical protein
MEGLVNIERSFSFQFEDKEWISKLGLGAIITIVPILNFAWTGYMVGIIRNVMAHAAEPLPTWDDLGKKFTDGLILFAAGLVYALPLIIVFCIPTGILAASGLLSGNQDLQDIGAVIGGIGGVLFFGLLCLFLVYGLVLSVVYPAILVMFAREGTFASCFKFRHVFELISRNTGPFLTAWGMSLLAGLGVGLIVGFAGGLVGWIPCIGWAAGLVLGLGSTVYISSIHAHLVGQFGAIAGNSSEVLLPPGS